jgi:hypothetical protein
MSEFYFSILIYAKIKGLESNERKSRHFLLIFGKFMKNGAFFVFAAFSESLSRKLQRFITYRKNKECYILHELSEYQQKMATFFPLGSLSLIIGLSWFGSDERALYNVRNP